jgi:predicted nucleic acid-binding protein
MYLLDTNTVIHYLNKALPAKSMAFLNGFIDEHCYVSIITQMEALGFDFKNKDEEIATETFMENAIGLGIMRALSKKQSPYGKVKK